MNESRDEKALHPRFVPQASLLCSSLSPSIHHANSLITSSEALSEPSSHLSPESRNLASLLCSKIYFYLGAINDAVNAALNAGEAFTRDSNVGTGEYKETIIGEPKVNRTTTKLQTK